MLSRFFPWYVETGLAQVLRSLQPSYTCFWHGNTTPVGSTTKSLTRALQPSYTCLCSHGSTTLVGRITKAPARATNQWGPSSRSCARFPSFSGVLCLSSSTADLRGTAKHEHAQHGYSTSQMQLSCGFYSTLLQHKSKSNIRCQDCCGLLSGPGTYRAKLPLGARSSRSAYSGVQGLCNTAMRFTRASHVDVPSRRTSRARC